MVGYMVSSVKKNIYKILKLCLWLVLGVAAGCLLPTLFSADTKEIADKISAGILSGLQGGAELHRVCFWGEFLPYALIVAVLWLTGGGRFGAFPAMTALFVYGVLWGIGINIVFALSFAYGMLVFLLCILPGNLMIAGALILIIIITGEQNGGFAGYSYSFIAPLLMVLAGCWYLVFGGPFLLNFVIKLI